MLLSLRCLRNRIHCHLIVTFIIKNVVFFIIWSTATDTNYIVQYPENHCEFSIELFPNKIYLDLEWQQTKSLQELNG
ncbi:hypothetical protein KUTeg_008371 [Tegillarca granosa]|uniref:Uncharacterized protein n=1 Tax=Tegillarca granosa TaxID=220873 RepID=A0ABQ9FC28_TEGGR|nr:hypothetical protein KUTeg_008371 [Tegillarca granosa]